MAFRQALQAAGFVWWPGTTGVEWWKGSIEVSWTDAAGAAQTATHAVEVGLDRGFPFAKPTANTLDGEATLPRSRHIAPRQHGALCLYADVYRPDTQRGWAAWRTGEEFLERLRDWYRRAHTGTWDERDRPPDLHTTFMSGGRPYPLMLVGADWRPPPGTSGRFGMWRIRDQASFAGAPVLGAGEIPTLHPDRILERFGVADHRFIRAGAWFRLREEPRPCRTLGEMLEEIDRAAAQPAGWALAECRRLVGVPPYRAVQVVLALGYPDPLLEAGEGWLFLRVDPPGRNKPLRWTVPAAIRQHTVQAFEATDASPAAMMRRNGSIARELAGKLVLVFGVGALGSVIALTLAKSGVERLHLVDHDLLRPGNVVRHVVGLVGLNHGKAIATKFDILQHAPDCDVQVADSTWDPARLREWVEAADVVVDATANGAFSLLLNEICIRARRPALSAVTKRRAAIGRVRVVRPGRDACLGCYLQLSERSGYPVVPAGDEGEFYDAGCGVPTVEAPAVDVDATALVAARTVLNLLRDRLGPRNHCLVVNDVLPEAEGVLAQEGVHWDTFGPVADCTTCGRPDVAPAPVASSARTDHGEIAAATSPDCAGTPLGRPATGPGPHAPA